MADADGAPRRVSMAYLLGFSDKPYKQVKQPAPSPLPQPRKPSHPANIMSTPGRIMEWTASDGRKGRLTGTGKPRLTAASLAKVPSEGSPPKAQPVAKSTSKKAVSVTPAAAPDDVWGNPGWGGTDVKNGWENLGSNKTSSNKDNAWDAHGISNDNSGPLASAWGTAPDATGGSDKKDERKENPALAWDAPAAPADAPAWDIPTALANVPARGDVDVADKDEKKNEDTDGWTKEQDEKLIQLKTENSKTWAQMGEEIGGKTKDMCTERFNKIKPAGWKPNNVEKKGEGKKGGAKDKNSKPDRNKGQGEHKKDSKWPGDNDKGGKAVTDPGDVWGGFDGGFTLDTNDDHKEDAAKNNDTAGGSNDNLDLWGNKIEAGGFTCGGNPDWDKGTGTGGAVTQGFDNQAWPTPPNPTSKPPANKTPAPTRSQPNASNNNSRAITDRPLALEVKPDDTFSADDLRLVARILQQDCSMVWNRVSWRFRDKTGRTLHPDEFEKKITGRLEGKGSEKGEWRR